MNAEISAGIDNISTRTLPSYQVEAPLSRLQILGRYARTGVAIALAMVPGFTASTAFAGGGEIPFLDVYCNKVGDNGYQLKMAYSRLGGNRVAIKADNGGNWNPDDSQDPSRIYSGDFVIIRNDQGLAGARVVPGSRYQHLEVISDSGRKVESNKLVDCNNESSREPKLCALGSIACMIREQQPLPVRIVFIR